MRLLLDTHALLWALAAPARLPRATAQAIRDPSNAVWVSAASIWEIAIKTALGKLKGDVGEIARAGADVGFDDLPITTAHACRVRELPAHHRDPFDRMLVAQAIEDGMTIVTCDPSFLGYHVQTLWK